MPAPCYCINLRRATQTVTRIYDEWMAPSGLRVTQYSLLRWLQHLGTASVGELATQAELDRTTLTRNLRSLRDAGYIEEAPCSDRRRRPLRLTAAGVDALSRAVPLWKDAQRRIEALLGTDSARDLQQLLARLEAGETATGAAERGAPAAQGISP